MKEQAAIQEFLRQKLAETQSQNPRYSMRAYAKRLGIHAGALSHILNGKRNVSRKMVEKIARRLLLDPQQRSELLELFPVKRPYTKNGDAPRFEPRYLSFTADQFKIASEWEHFAVLSLLNCEDFESSVEWMAKRLGCTPSRVSQAVDRLLQLELLEFDSRGGLRRSNVSYRTPDDIADTSLKKHHEQTLELAKTSIYRDPVAVRDFTSITMAIDPRKLSLAKELVRKYLDELSDLLESGHRTEVYRFSAQLFPLSCLNVKEVE